MVLPRWKGTSNDLMKLTSVPATTGWQKTEELLFFPSSTHLYTGQVSVLGCHVDSSVSVLVDFVQRDCLFLHELKQPQQDLLLQRQTERTAFLHSFIKTSEATTPQSSSTKNTHTPTLHVRYLSYVSHKQLHRAHPTPHISTCLHKHDGAPVAWDVSCQLLVSTDM